MASDFDVLIAGGGPAGSALALALADGKRRIAVVEARAPVAGDSARSIALSAGSARLLDALGVWSGLGTSAVAIDRVEVSQEGHFGRTRIDATEEGLAALGYVVGHERLADALATAAAAAPGVDWLAPARVSAAAPAEGGVTVRVEADDAVRAGAFRARLVVAADGTTSPLRDALGIGTTVHDYEQTALLAPVEAGGEPHTAHERFTAEGPMALLPLGGARRTLVWSLAAERAAELAEAPAAAFAEAAARRLGRGLAPLRVQRAPVAQPLQRIEAERCIAERAAVIGNAARTLHPVGAQGFNLALRDVCTLAEAVHAAPDPGASSVLEGWQHQRRGDQWRTRAFTDVLARRFHGATGAAAAARAGALLGLDLFGAGRHGLAAQTTGLLGGLPRVGRWRLDTDVPPRGEAP